MNKNKNNEHRTTNNKPKPKAEKKSHLGSWQSVYTQLCHRMTFCIVSLLKHCAANRKRRFSALPNVGPYIYDVKISAP
jgi:hypothetical protein